MSPKKASAPRRRAPSRRGGKRRKGRKGHVFSFSEQGGELIAADGYLFGDRAAAKNLIEGNGGISGFIYNLKESTPLLGTDSALASNRQSVGTGAIVLLGGRVLESFGVRSPRLKLGKKLALKLWGR
jgi:hypothetical protein